MPFLDSDPASLRTENDERILRPNFLANLLNVLFFVSGDLQQVFGCRRFDFSLGRRWFFTSDRRFDSCCTNSGFRDFHGKGGNDCLWQGFGFIFRNLKAECL